MLSLKYATLSTVEANHSYYHDGQCSEVIFEAFKSTLEIVGEYNIKFAIQPGKLRIIGKVEDNNGLLSPDPPLVSPLCLQFFLKITDNSLGNTAELDGTRQFYLSNLFPDFTVEHPLLTQGANLSDTEACPTVFANTYTATVEAGKFSSLTIKRYWPGGLVQFAKINIDAAKETIRVSNIPDGRYRLEWEKSDLSGTLQEEVFVSSEARDSSNWLAVVEIFLTPALVANLSNPPSFRFIFAFKAKPWTYFLIDWKKKVDFPSDAALLTIERNLVEDEKKEHSRLPDDITFNQLEPAALTPEERKSRAGLLLGASVKDVYVFKSQGAIPFLDGDAPTLQLIRTDTAKSLIKELPAPSSGSPDASVFFNI